MERKEPKLKTCAWTDCENQFRPRFKTTEKFCSSECTWKAHKEKNKHKKPKQNRINRRSEKRSKQERLYSAKRIEFLSRKGNKYCPVAKYMMHEMFGFITKREYNDWTNHIFTCQVHHMKGRIGDLLTDERYWLAVSDKGHKFIENNPEIAKEKGWSLSRLQNGPEFIHFDVDG